MPPFQDLIADVKEYWQPDHGDVLVGTVMQVGWDTDDTLAADIQPEEGIQSEEGSPKGGFPKGKAPRRVRIGDKFWKDWSETSPSRGDLVKITYQETPLMRPETDTGFESDTYEGDSFESDSFESKAFGSDPFGSDPFGRDALESQPTDGKASEDEVHESEDEAHENEDSLSNSLEGKSSTGTPPAGGTLPGGTPSRGKSSKRGKPSQGRPIDANQKISARYVVEVLREESQG